MSQAIATATVSGITATVSGRTFSGLLEKTNALMFSSGIIGASVTSYSTTGAPVWDIEVYTRVAGADFQIAGISSIASTASVIVPIRNAQGLTQHNFIGIPRPTSVTVRAQSATLGSTFSVVVEAHLHNSP